MSSSLQLLSTVQSDGNLRLSLVDRPVPEPKAADDIVVQIDATPLNPSDIATLLALADSTTATVGESEGLPTLTAKIMEAAMPRFRTRIDKPMPVGNEAAGTVVAAGESDYAQSLIGKTVSFVTGGNYAQHALMNAMQCMPMADGVSAKDAASAFVNPLTALGFVETMKSEGHKALINTAAASNLGQMLNRIAQADGFDVVNVVRKPEQVDLLKGVGAKYIVNSSAESYQQDLVDAISETGATIAFDALGGGAMADQLLSAMERAASKDMEHYDHYGSSVYKQLYNYGGLVLAPTTLSRSYGFAWGMGGWLLTNFLMKTDPQVVGKLRERVSKEIKTTFATNYSHEISLREALQPDIVQEYAKQATGEKYLIRPQQ